MAGPDVDTKLKEPHRIRGRMAALVSFVCDHAEVLYDPTIPPEERRRRS
jgi:hypothetical protein